MPHIHSVVPLSRSDVSVTRALMLFQIDRANYVERMPSVTINTPSMETADLCMTGSEHFTTTGAPDGLSAGDRERRHA